MSEKPREEVIAQNLALYRKLHGQTEKCKSTQEKIKYAEHDRKELERAKKKALERAKKQKKHNEKK